jgi:uncharacterized RDD family membrane protein YckC
MLNEQPRDLAGFGERLFADIVDYVIATVGSFLIWLIVDRWMLGGQTGFMSDDGPPKVADFALFAWFLWNGTYLVGKTGQSWGRKLVGIKVVDAEGGPIGFWRALGRNVFAALVSAPLFFLGFLWVLWDADKQAWHDKVFRTYVVST